MHDTLASSREREGAKIYEVSHLWFPCETLDVCALMASEVLRLYGKGELPGGPTGQRDCGATNICDLLRAGALLAQLAL